MTFLSGARLLLFLLLLVLVAAYLWRQRQRRRYAVRFTNIALLDSVAPKRPGWRRHVSAVAFALALSSLLVAFARPAHVTRVPAEKTTIVVAIDVSGSMAATDVVPSRLEAAKTAASAFVKLLPPNFDVGLVAFNQAASVLVAPTNDHALAVTAINNLQVGGGTAIGEAIFAALDSLAATPVPANGQAPPARIVLMSDGATNSGRSNDDAAQAAGTSHVPVTTIAYGTDTGQLQLGNQVIDVPADKPALQRIANQTGGHFFQAASAGQLQQVYAAIRSAVAYRIQHRDISAWFLGLGLVLLAMAATASLVWSPVLP
jgi:Ca-activated chloride channel family protein